MKYISLVVLLAVSGCSSPQKAVKQKPPDQFDYMMAKATRDCYAAGWTSSWFCMGMASEMANEYIAEHPERLKP